MTVFGVSPDEAADVRPQVQNLAVCTTRSMEETMNDDPLAVCMYYIPSMRSVVIFNIAGGTAK